MSNDWWVTLMKSGDAKYIDYSFRDELVCILEIYICEINQKPEHTINSAYSFRNTFFLYRENQEINFIVNSLCLK